MCRKCYNIDMFEFKRYGIDFSHKYDLSPEPTYDEDEGHIHLYTEMLYFISGDVDYTVDSQTHKLAPHDMVLISPGKYHCAKINPKVPYERYVLKFPNTVIPPYFIEKIKQMNAFYSSAKKYNINLSLLDSYYGNFPEDDMFALCVAEVSKIIIMLSQNKESVPKQVNAVIDKLITYIDEHITQNITLDMLSSECHFSKSYINSEFKKYTDMPLMKYIKAKKIVAAHDLILSGQKKSAVAFMFGFKDYSTFYRQYQKYKNITELK